MSMISKQDPNIFAYFYVLLFVLVSFSRSASMYMAKVGVLLLILQVLGYFREAMQKNEF